THTNRIQNNMMGSEYSTSHEMLVPGDVVQVLTKSGSDSARCVEPAENGEALVSFFVIDQIKYI
ncbi:MAG: hypothetical protein AAF551_08095, partial [Bacteroidota bacterium]